PRLVVLPKAGCVRRARLPYRAATRDPARRRHPVGMSKFITAEQVSVTIDREVLLPPVSFSLDAGQALAVTGANGTGKTTLLRVLAGLIPPTAGTAMISGAVPDERRREFRALVAALIGTPQIGRAHV